MATEMVDNESLSWYSRVIEEPVRELVYLLRNNGWNTECSCGHQMYVQCQYIPDGRIQELHNLLYSYLYDNKRVVDFDIEITIKVRNGQPYPTLRINLSPKTQ
jgi:hypothetical protein